MHKNINQFEREPLLSLLILYAKEINKLTEEIDRSKLISIPYERIRLTAFERKYRRISYQYDFENIEYFIKHQISDNTDFMNHLNALLDLPEALNIGNHILEFIPTAHNGAKGILHYTLDNFTRYIMEDTINNAFDINIITDWANRLINDIELIITKKRDLMKWQISLELANLYLDEIPDMQEDDEYSFEPITKEELEIERIRTNHIDNWEKWTSKSQNETTKLVLYCLAQKEGIGVYPESIKHKIDTELNLIRLYTVASIYPIYEIVMPLSFIYSGIQSEKEIPSETYSSEKVGRDDCGTFPFIVTQSTFLSFQQFRKSLYDPISKIDPKKYLDGDYIDIAFHRYLDALLRSEVYAYRILSAISSLEALLSNNEPEVTFKLKSRLAILLSCVNIQGKDVSDKMTTAYDLRSRIVHGDKLKEDQFKFARNSCVEVLNYARIAFLICVQLRSEYNKKEFINLLNDALIDKNEFEKLKTKIINLVIPL